MNMLTGFGRFDTVQMSVSDRQTTWAGVQLPFQWSRAGIELTHSSLAATEALSDVGGRPRLSPRTPSAVTSVKLTSARAITHKPTPEGQKAELALLADRQRTF